MLTVLKHKFVDAIPEQLDEGIIYISGNRRIAVHLCVCGCGNEVVTPFAPTDWQLSFNGDTISLRPSIGNWQFECRSHYFITENRVIHSGRWNDIRVQAGRKRDKERRDAYFNEDHDQLHRHKTPENKAKNTQTKLGLKIAWDRLLNWFGSLFNKKGGMIKRE